METTPWGAAPAPPAFAAVVEWLPYRPFPYASSALLTALRPDPHRSEAPPISAVPRPKRPAQDERQAPRLPGADRHRTLNSGDTILTTQRGKMATSSPRCFFRGEGPRPCTRRTARARPSPRHPRLRRGYPTSRGEPPPLVGLSPGLCGSDWSVAYFPHRTVSMNSCSVWVLGSLAGARAGACSPRPSRTDRSPGVSWSAQGGAVAAAPPRPSLRRDSPPTRPPDPEGASP